MGTIKKIFETSWGGMVRRSSGDIVRTEDKRNPVKMSAEDCVALLKEGIVLFVYRKKRPKNAAPGEVGELRVAWGTKCFDSLNFPVPARKNNGGFDHGGEIYIDMDSQHWRTAREILGAYDQTFSTKEYETIPEAERKQLVDDLLKVTDLYDEYEAQLEAERIKAEEKRKREEARLAAAGLETGGDTPVDGEPTV